MATAYPVLPANVEKIFSKYSAQLGPVGYGGEKSRTGRNVQKPGPSYPGPRRPPVRRKLQFLTPCR
jgi:hypothetical protein